MSSLSPKRLALFIFALTPCALAQTPATPATPAAPTAASAAAPAATTPVATAAAVSTAKAPATPPRTGPSPYSASVQKGDSAYIARDYDGAIAAYREEIEKNPNGALAHYRTGEAELAKGDLDEAEKSWQTALRFVGKDERLKSKILFVLADLKERQKAYDDAVTRWKDYQQHAEANKDANGYPATAIERIKRVEQWKKISSDAAEVKARIEKRNQEADESMKKSSK